METGSVNKEHVNHPRYVFTLVHGTFSRNAPWCKPNSIFRKALTEAINGSLHFEIFRWSWWNSNRARVKWAKALAEHLKRLHALYPDARQFVIAHSHGGNVARYALRDFEAAKCLSGIITLATPFITVKERPYEAWLWNFVRAFVIQAQVLAFVVVLVPIVMGLYMAQTYNKVLGDFYVKVITKSFVIIGVIMPVVGCLLYLMRKLYLNWIEQLFAKFDERLSSIQSAFFDDYFPPIVKNLPILYAVPSLDEPNIWLVGINRARETIVRFLTDKSLILCLLFILPLPPLWITDLLPLYPFVFLIEVLFLPFLLGLLFLFGNTALRAGRPVGYGAGSWLENWVLDVSHEPEPFDWEPKRPEYCQVRQSWWKVWLWFAHSRIHDTPAVAAAIAAWIKEQGRIGPEEGKEPEIRTQKEQTVDAATFVKFLMETRPDDWQEVLEKALDPENK